MLSKTLATLIERADALGLDAKYVNECSEYLFHKEYELCLDTLVTQLYEFDISIDDQFYNLIKNAAVEMKLSDDDHSFMKELIK